MVVAGLEGHAQNVTLVAGQAKELPAGIPLPDPDGAVLPGGGQRAPSGLKATARTGPWWPAT